MATHFLGVPAEEKPASLTGGDDSPVEQVRWPGGLQGRVANAAGSYIRRIRH